VETLFKVFARMPHEVSVETDVENRKKYKSISFSAAIRVFSLPV